MKAKLFTTAICALLLLSSCSITKMRYTRGINIEFLIKNDEPIIQNLHANRAKKVKAKTNSTANEELKQINENIGIVNYNVMPTNEAEEHKLSIVTKSHIIKDKQIKYVSTHSNVKQATSINKTAKQDKTRLAAYILCTYFGWLGIHRFYLGYTTIGLIQMFTLGGLFIWWFIDLVRILFNDLKPKNEDYVP